MSELGFSCNFIFEPGEYDAEFHELDARIDAYARTLEGFIRTERWQSSDGKLRNSIYYFSSMAAITELARFAPHREAKQNYARWYKGYRIEIAEIRQVYGDGNLS